MKGINFPALAILVAVLLCWPAVRSWAAQAEPRAGAEKDAASQIPDPFYPKLPAETVQIRYRIQGRFEGQEMLAAKAGKEGFRKVREIRATDTALGLERPIHLWILETPDKVVQLDLVHGTKEVRPNLRKILSRAWSDLGEEQKTNLAKNLPAVGPIIGKELKLSVAVADQGGFLGLPGTKVALGSGLAWYWAQSDLLLKSLGQQGGFSWTEEAIDIIQDQELDESLFQMPNRGQDPDLPEVPAQDLAWAQGLARKIIALLSQPLVGQENPVRTIQKQAVIFRLAIPWPHPAPPGFRESMSQYRVDPNWTPHPAPPDQRPWPPPGLGSSILKVELQEICALLTQRMPGTEKPDPDQPARPEKTE